MKKFIAVCMAGLMLAGMPVNAFAEGIMYENAPVAFSSQEPVIIDGRTYVPIRDVFERLGFKVDWDADTKIVGLENDYYNTTLTTGTSKIIVLNVNFDLIARRLENEVKIINGRTMLPLREILEAMNYELAWDAETKTTTITDKNDYEELGAALKKIENMTNKGSEEYAPDTSKPVGEFTAEEKAWLENLYTILSGEKYTDIANSAQEDAKKLEELAVLIVKDIESVECPDSLKGVKASVYNTLDSVKSAYFSINQLEGLLEDETDEVKSQNGLLIGFSMMAKMAASVAEVKSELDSFYTSGNYDPETELGSVYPISGSDDAEFEPAEGVEILE